MTVSGVMCDRKGHRYGVCRACGGRCRQDSKTDLCWSCFNAAKHAGAVARWQLYACSACGKVSPSAKTRRKGGYKGGVCPACRGPKARCCDCGSALTAARFMRCRPCWTAMASLRARASYEARRSHACVRCGRVPRLPRAYHDGLCPACRPPKPHPQPASRGGIDLQMRARIKSLNGAVCQYYRLSWAQIRAHTRIKEECEARQVLMYILSHELGLSRMEVGRVLRRDQSTITHAVHKIARSVENDRLMRGAVETIRLYYRASERAKQAA